MKEAYQDLEVCWAEFNELDPAGMVACSSGTAALHLAFEALQLPPGSEIICPDFAMIACARAVTLAGLTPVFVDCGDDLNMDTALLQNRSAEENEFRAALFVHTYGRQLAIPDDFPAWFWVEDLAEAHGIRPNPATDAACWSFFKNKVVAGEEGGAVWFRDPTHAALARQLRCLGFTDAHDFQHIPRGWNHRLSNANASLVLDSLRIVDRNIQLRRELEVEFNKACPSEWRMPYRDCPWVFDIRIPGLTSTQQGCAVHELQRVGVAARHSFKPLSCQEEYRGCVVIHGDRHEALITSAEVIYLPLTPRASVGVPSQIFKIIKNVVLV